MSAPLQARLRDPPRTVLVVLAAIAAALALLCAGCNYGEVRIVEPAAKGQGPLTLSIQADPEDTSVARELGWTAGIPAAAVTITAGGGDTAVGPPVATLQTDSAGRVSVPDLPDGNYFVAVRRLLTSAEVARLAPTEDVIGFMTQAVVTRGNDTLSVPSSRRHSLVISEWSFQPAYVAGAYNPWYDFGGFLELANNSDTTVYLDGLVIGEGWAVAEDYGRGDCARNEYLTNDPDGVWARYMDSLPGTGRTYPLAPGAVAVIATDAIDHSGIAPGGLDLSHANFEFVGTSDADNPSVPNTISLKGTYWFGHGLFLNETLQEVAFVALPVDTTALPRAPGNGFERVPRARILDVIALLSTYQFPDALCPHLVHRNFDRYRARLMVDEPWNQNPGLHSVQRKVAYVRADGSKILQHTRTTNADFFWGLRTPGQLP